MQTWAATLFQIESTQKDLENNTLKSVHSEPSGQFHQHFMSEFAPILFCQKKFKPKA
jgi:hypothetical protein